MYGNNSNSSGYGGNTQYGGNNSYGANRPNNYGGNSQGGNSYGGNNHSGNSYGGNNNGSSGYGGNNSNSYGNGGSNQRPGQYGQQTQQYGQSQQYGQQYGNNQQNYGGNNYGGNNNYGGYQRPVPGQETEEDVNQVSQQIRDVRQESVQSTRNALRALQEADESGVRTMNQLAEQSEQLGRIERSLDSAQIHADNAQEKAGELKTVNRSMFAIHIKNPFNSTKKKERELEEAKRKAAEELAQRESIRREEYDSKQRVNAATGQGPYGRGPGSNPNNYSNNGRGGTGERNMYSFENTAEDDEAEREIDNNLDMMSNYLDRLKASASTMNTEVNRQNQRMTGVTEKTDNLSGSVTHNTNLLQKIAKRG
ncbi:Protein transport protein S9 plasma membrane t-SNARE [Entomortierella beljakovae]|nr:Protein transport protein S9 plasma membrane t-SNARE [Entomortierella beljakovae]